MSDSRALMTEKDARLLNRIMLDIAKEMRIDRRFDGRINNLQLLDDRKRPDETICRMSQPEWKDHPQIQILLERRDRYLACRENLAAAQEALRKCAGTVDPEELPSCLRAVAKLEAQCGDHLKALESCFVAIRHETAIRTKTRTEMLTKAATMAETARMHAERLEVEKRKLGEDVNDVIGRVLSGEEEE